MDESQVGVILELVGIRIRLKASDMERWSGDG